VIEPDQIPLEDAPMSPGILTITTDFGVAGPYVAAMKGILVGMVPEAKIIDVCHTISPQNIVEGAYVLAGIVDYFPENTVHLAVIDPGVGTDRRLIAVSILGQWFVLPDNGLITGVARGKEPDGIWEIANPALWRPQISATFHGRDILAPAAAHLLAGGDPADLGPLLTRFATLRNFEPSFEDQGFIGEVIFKDAFGNLITNVHSDRLDDTPQADWEIEIAGERITGINRTYGQRPTGSLIAIVGSTGWVEIAVVNGDAARLLMVGSGTTVRIRRIQ
jgi:S-adenosylmethionine hydrolase